MARASSRIVVYAALAGNLLIAVAKFFAAAWTGSSAMLSEGVHSLVDTLNQVLILYGMHRAAKPPDENHPFGHSRELYFWSFVVALLIFSLGAGVSVYEGIAHIQEPVAITSPSVSYVVLGLSGVFEGASWAVAMRHFRAERGDLGLFEAVTRSKDPTTFIVLFEDSAALVGIAIALVGTFLADKLDMPLADGTASIGIGIVLGGTAIFLARESKGLLIGEPALLELRRSIMSIAQGAEGIDRAANLVSVQLGPKQVFATLDAEFCDDLTANQIEQAVGALEHKIRARHPEVVALYIRPRATSRSGRPASDLTTAAEDSGAG